MSIFVTASSAPSPKTKNIRPVALAFATALVVMTVAQLFTFEKFPDVIGGLWLPGGETFAPIRAAVIVILEIAALPFLLSMRLSPPMRVASMLAGWAVVAAWFFVSVWENVVSSTINNAGLLGATIELPVGWWSAFFFVALGVLAAWASWGMWPLGQKSKK